MLACHYFFKHVEYFMYSHLLLSLFLLLCSAAQKMSSLMKTSSRRMSPRSSACGTMVSLPLLSPFGLVISFFIKI
jgi:hypothetical protein